MLKKSAFKKILISTLSLFIVSIFYFFPHANVKNNIKEEVTIKDYNKSIIYLPNNDNLVSRINVISKENEIKKQVHEIISYLTINNTYNEYLPNIFKPIIPKDTKILNLDIIDDLLKINFSKNLYNVNINDERKMLESIVYSLTELNGINKIMIFIEGNHLNELFHSKEKLPLTLDRNIGVNLSYEINDFKNANLVTTYYVAKTNNYYYYIPISKLINTNKEKVEIIIEELQSFPIYQTNLMSFLKKDAKLLDYEILENEVMLSFNNYLLDDISKNEILEEVKYSIGLSLSDTYNVKNIIFKVDGKSEKLTFK